MKKTYHFFDENDSLCRLTDTFTGKVREYLTYCGRSIGKVKLHTEDISQVSCLQCLSAINKINKVMYSYGRGKC